MNHYPHHIGDYLKKTIGLTMRQDGAYRRMLDLYYGDEKPLPLDRVDLYGSLRCRDRADQGAVEHCLRKYFFEREDGFHHDRCDEEIAKYREKSAKASASASARWEQTESERNANALPENMRTHSVGNAKAMLAINHKPVTISKTLNPLSSSPLANVDDADPGKRLNGKHYGEQARELLEFLNVKTGRYFRPTEATLRPIVARLREGHDVSTCKAVIVRRWRDWKDDDKMRRFLRPATLFGAEKFAQYVGEVPTDADMERENANEDMS